MSVRHNWLVYKLQIAPTVDKKAFPNNREEFQSLTIPHEFIWEKPTKVNNSCEGSTCRPIWSAITLGRMLTDAQVSHKSCGNSISFTVHGIANCPGLLFFFNVTFFLIFSLASQNILLMSSPFSLVSLKNTISEYNKPPRMAYLEEY
ncbi:hypothetical protein F2Q69_00037156 [Brassica cretica]|uniref:Uncharacterized protein n=1 Tax=Brassica cretica TaxID=69181 RepID=A0A8S9SEQ3_BRACR|nr:hypothetical protein F2Q69_00037156 [Brassica cretica]